MKKRLAKKIASRPYQYSVGKYFKALKRLRCPVFRWSTEIGLVPRRVSAS